MVKENSTSENSGKIWNWNKIDNSLYTAQNGVSDRENRILVESARSMLHAKKLPPMLWAEAVNTVAYVLNLTDLTTESKSPYYIIEYEKNIQDIDHLILVSKYYIHILKQKCQKWDCKTIKEILISYCGK